MSEKEIDDYSNIEKVKSIVEGLTISDMIEKFKLTSRTPELIATKEILESIKILDEPTLVEQIKSTITPVLNLFNRNDVEIKIFDQKHPNIGNFGGTYLVISKSFLHLIDDNNLLLCAVAHEMAHDFFAQLSIISRIENSPALNSCIELMCDAVSAQAMRELNIDPIIGVQLVEKLKGSLTLMQKFEAEFLTMQGVNPYPSYETRIELFKALSNK